MSHWLEVGSQRPRSWGPCQLVQEAGELGVTWEGSRRHEGKGAGRAEGAVAREPWLCLDGAASGGGVAPRLHIREGVSGQGQRLPGPG